MTEFLKSTPSIVERMEWTDEGFKCVKNDTLLIKRNEMIGRLEKFTFNHRCSCIELYMCSDFDKSVYSNRSYGTTYYYTGDGSWFNIPENPVVYKKLILNRLYFFVYYNQREADRDKDNRELFGKRLSFKYKEVRINNKDYYQLETINLFGNVENATIFYYDIEKETWFWKE